jgi:hypothetical protein
MRNMTIFALTGLVLLIPEGMTPAQFLFSSYPASSHANLLSLPTQERKPQAAFQRNLAA